MSTKKKTKVAPKVPAKNGAIKAAEDYKLSAPKSTKGRRTNYSLPVMIYFTKEQKAALAKKAELKGLGLSTFIREQALAAQ